jgi:plasmid rolling circle replication initiator protein Rep
MENLKSIVSNDQFCVKETLSETIPDQKPWDRHGCEREDLSSVYLNNKSEDIDWLEKQGKRIAECSHFLWFSKSDSDSKYKLKAFFCKVRTCPVCQWRRSLQISAKIFERFETWPGVKDKRLLFLTLTVPNCSIAELRETIKKINRGWQRLSQRESFPAVGWLKNIEVTRNLKDDTAHPHCHVLLLVEPHYFKGSSYLKHEDWLQLWRDCYRDQTITQVDIRTVRRKHGEILKEMDSKTMAGVVAEISKYPTKPSDILGKKVSLKKGIEADSVNREWIDAYAKAVRKLRFVDTGGILRGLLADDKKTGQETEEEASKDKIRMCFKWSSRRRYEREKRYEDR